LVNEWVVERNSGGKDLSGVYVCVYYLDIDYHPMMMLDVIEIDTILFLCLVSLVQLSGRESSRLVGLGSSVLDDTYTIVSYALLYSS
jgi:hypothetical protein